MPSNHLILCHPLLLPPSILPSIRVFLNVSALCIFETLWSFSFSISPSNEHPGLISFRMNRLDLLAAFYIVQLSHPYMTTGKTISLTRWTFVGKLMSLLYNMLSRLVISFLPRSKFSFNFMTAVTICSDFGALKNKISHCFHCFPIYWP